MADLLITENSSWSGGFDSADNLAAILDSDHFGYVGNKIVLDNIKFDNSKADLKIYTDSAEFTGGFDVFYPIGVFDISTLTEQSDYDYQTAESVPAGDGRGIFVSPNGEHLYYITREGTDTIYQYSMSTAFDLSTLSYVREQQVDTDVGSTGFTMSNDGTKYAYCGSGSDTIRYGTLSTAWDISTISSSTEAQSSFNDNNLGSIQFVNDGQYFFRGSTGGTSYAIFELASAYDLSTTPTTTNNETGGSGAFMCVNKQGTRGIGRYNTAVDAPEFYEHHYSTAYDPTTYSIVDSDNMTTLTTNGTTIDGICTSTETTSGAERNAHVYIIDNDAGYIVHLKSL